MSNRIAAIRRWLMLSLIVFALGHTLMLSQSQSQTLTEQAELSLSQPLAFNLLGS